MMDGKQDTFKNDDKFKDDDDLELVGIPCADEADSDPIEIPADHHKLQFQYWLWFSKQWSAKRSAVSYEKNLKLIGKFGSVEQFWAIYGHLVHPSDLPNCEYHIFKLGIKPMWEDECNINGGRWILRLRKGLVSRFWENLVLAMLGEQFMVGEEICGCVVSVKLKEDNISIWNKTASDHSTRTRIRDTLRRVLNLPANTNIEYKPHANSYKT